LANLVCIVVCSYNSSELNNGADKLAEQRTQLLESRRWDDNPVHAVILYSFICSAYLFYMLYIYISCYFVTYSLYFPCQNLNLFYPLFFYRRQELVFLDNEIVFNEAIIEERDQGIQEIQHQITEVNEIFKDLAVLVHDQGAMIGM
jgi:hypothetical protein